MTSFTDSASNVWTLTVNVNTIRRVKALVGITLTDIVKLDGGAVHTDLLEQLANDPCLLVDTLFAIIKPEADAKGITDEAFGASLAGDALEDATKALIEEVINFFPSAKRKILQTMLNASRRFASQQMQNLDKMIQDGTVEKAIDTALNRSSGFASN